MTGGSAKRARVLARATVAIGLAAVTAGQVGAANAQAPSPAADVLAAHCARCHNAPALENPPAKGNLGNTGDLAALSQRDDLIRPGDPDASRLYQIMLGRHRPLAVFFGPVPGPTAAEIETVRDWIAALKPRDETCPDRQLLGAAEVSKDAAAWRTQSGAGDPEDWRFISLAPLYNLCRDDARLAAYRGAVEQTLSTLAGGKPVLVDTVGDASVLLAVRLTDLGLDKSGWSTQTGVTEPDAIVEAHAIAAHILTNPSHAGALNSATEGLIEGLPPAMALASEYTRGVSLQRAAAESGLRVAALRDRLESITPPPAGTLARRLQQTGLNRTEWNHLRAVLEGRSAPADSTAGAGSLALHLWTDKSRYDLGDLLSVNAKPTGDCYLTIVAVEADGSATVLFPNDTATDNLVTGGTVVTVPPPGSGYQLRLNKRGRQTIAGICNARAKRPEGIGHDFERQRFTSLGDWRAFLASTAEREEAYQKTQEEMRRFRAGRGAGAEPLAEQLPVGTEDEARAGLSFRVYEPGTATSE